jgi:hypothetical protein
MIPMSLLQRLESSQKRIEEFHAICNSGMRHSKIMSKHFIQANFGLGWSQSLASRQQQIDRMHPP